MDYEVTGEFEADMTDYLATEGENLIASRNFAAAFELGQASYELLHEIDIDDSNGVMLTILTYITELWEEVMEFATAKDIEPFFIWATQRLNNKEDFFTEDLIAVLTNLGEEKLEFAPRIVK
ncbi:hypothetical protein JZO76_06010 [Enterococcus sp. MJM12]|uniref:Uncharacterized protein n=1 Tax=Candidatus Enterococcus myersii TaxID=2815322 RepID=A0ABS3H8Y8_9ENTE|nr:hypothetical protein [Enterococcus sp. MJM12]MBO0449088.1 hypothetical protein [Enterococcus sp. MJM12]